MNLECLKSDIIDLYYGENNLSLKEIALRHGVTLAQCQQELQNIALVAKGYADLQQYNPSQMSLNKIMAHAREKAQNLQKRPFWYFLLRPAYSLSMILVIAVVSVTVWTQIKTDQTTFVADHSKQVEVFDVNDIQNTPTLKERLFTTPLDLSKISPDYRLSSKQKYFNPLVKEVGMGEQDDPSLIDDELDQKMLKQALSSHDLEALFLRARKLEKQGYVQEALRDYLYLLRSNSFAGYQKVLPLAIARCHEQLGDKTAALSVILDYEKNFGKTEDLEFWKDQLKSETF